MSDLAEQLHQLEATHAELAARLGSPEVLGDPRKRRETTRALAEIEPVVTLFRSYREVERQLGDARSMVESSPAGDELRALAEEEAATLAAKKDAIESELRRELVPKDP